MNEYRICSRCVLDTSVSEIHFDENGICNYCKLHHEFINTYPLGKDSESLINSLIEKIIINGRGKKYDCIIGVSGGTDSVFLLYWAVKIAGLRPLSVTFDNGWNAEVAVSNIKNATEILKVDLHTVVADWEEMKDLQRSFLKASVSDADAPSDYAIYSVLYKEAVRWGVKYSLNGHSFRMEGSVPKSWSYFDGRYVKDVQKRYGSKKIKSFPLMSMTQFAYWTIFRGIRNVRVLDYIDYDKTKAKEIITKELAWRDYGGHHHENHFTRFFQSYYLPVKFNIDKRKVEYSALINSGQIKREEVVNVLKEPYPYEPKDVDYVIKKLELSNEEWREIMNSPRKTFKEFKTYYPIIRAAKFPLKVAARLKLIPKILYEKYAKM